MKDAKRKTSRPRVRGELSPGWQLFFGSVPELWIPGLIALVSIQLFGIPEDFGLAVFVVSLIVLLMIASVVGVYLFGRSFKRGKIASRRSENGRS